MSKPSRSAERIATIKRLFRWWDIDKFGPVHRVPVPQRVSGFVPSDAECVEPTDIDDCTITYRYETGWRNGRRMQRVVAEGYTVLEEPL